MPQQEAPLSTSRRSSSRFTRHETDASVNAALLGRAVAAAKDQDQDALRFLYVRFADDVCRYVNTIVSDRHAAEDITQTIFSKLLAKMRHYEAREVPFKGWLFRVAHNAAIDHVRGRRVIPFEEVPRSRDI
jgi:RNA polymerase sigma-70 factor (ECF subfamily)